MPLAPSARLGPYEIESELGAGGMGEVYRARDTRLDRAVAIKVLSAPLAGDAQFRERFDREARAISQLPHPNICTLHDVGEYEGTPYLVMELLDGESLEARLAGGAQPLATALSIAIDIVTALDAAHRAGIVHRDLKPGNIFLVRGATASAPPVAKLLDFGLAKSRTPALAVSGLSTAPTTPPASMTIAGSILGTLQYMAPEQIDGVESDARTDLFAFGCVLFELLAGRKAFEGKTRAALLGAILKDEPPPVSQLAPDVPASLDRLVQTCLAKEPDDRWQTARDVLRELKWIAREPKTKAASIATPTPPAKRSPAMTIAAAVAGAAVAGAIVWSITRPAPIARPVVRLQAPPAQSAPVWIDGIAPDLAISRDGTTIVFTAGSAEPQLFVRRLDRTDATPIAGTNGARGPFFSPDGESVAYFQNADLKRVPVGGGPPTVVCTQCAPGNRGGTWSDDDTIVFAASGGSTGVLRVPASGGDPVAVTKVAVPNGEIVHTWPEMVPGGQSILFSLASGSLENSSVVIQHLGTEARTVVARRGSQPHLVGTTHVAYVFGGTLFAVPIDAARAEVLGPPVPVVEGVATKSTGAANFAVAANGTLAYISGESQTGGSRLAWFDRNGHEEPIPAPPRAYMMPRISPDGTRVALDVRDAQNDIWVWDFGRGVLQRLTTDPGTDQYPVWTPDGRRLAFSSSRAGVPNVFWQASDGTGTAERLLESKVSQWPLAFTRDGRNLIVRNATTSIDVGVVTMNEPRAYKALLDTHFNELNAEVSPDGRWLMYESSETGRPDIHVRPFPDVDGGHWQVSPDGGSRPVWSRDGREAFFLDAKGRLVSISIQPGEKFVAGNPEPIMQLANLTAVASPARFYDVSPDGKRFLVIRPLATADQKPVPSNVHVVLNWGEELKRLAPAKKP